MLADTMQLQNHTEDDAATTNQNTDFLCSHFYCLMMMIMQNLLPISHCSHSEICHSCLPTIRDHSSTCKVTYAPRHYLFTIHCLKQLQCFYYFL